MPFVAALQFGIGLDDKALYYYKNGLFLTSKPKQNKVDLDSGVVIILKASFDMRNDHYRPTLRFDTVC